MKRRLACILVVLLSAATPVLGAVVAPPIMFTDRAGWNNAVGDRMVVEDFETVPAVNFSVSGQTVSFPHFDLVVPPNHGGLRVGGPGAIFGSSGFRGDVHGGSEPEFARFLFAVPLVAFAADFADLNEGGLELHFDGLVVAVPDGTTFLGLRSANPFTSLEVRTSALEEFYRMDNISLGAIPEPSAGLLALLALAGSMVIRRRPKRESK